MRNIYQKTDHQAHYQVKNPRTQALNSEIAHYQQFTKNKINDRKQNIENLIKQRQYERERNMLKNHHDHHDQNQDSLDNTFQQSSRVMENFTQLRKQFSFNRSSPIDTSSMNTAMNNLKNTNTSSGTTKNLDYKNHNLSKESHRHNNAHNQSQEDYQQHHTFNQNKNPNLVYRVQDHRQSSHSPEQNDHKSSLHHLSQKMHDSLNSSNYNYNCPEQVVQNYSQKSSLNHQNLMNSQIESNNSPPNLYMYKKAKTEFNASLSTNNNQNNILRSKYISLTSDIKILESEEVVDLLLEEIDQNQKYKNQLLKKQVRIDKLEEQVDQLHKSLEKKREAINLLCQTESKNLNMIEKMEARLRNSSEILREGHYQRQYRQLSGYMNEYIQNINQAQQQFRRNYTLLKNQNSRLHLQAENINSSIVSLEKRNRMLEQGMNKYENNFKQIAKNEHQMESELKNLLSTNQELRTELESLKGEYEAVKKELQTCQENMKITDRIQAQQDYQFSSELDFIRQKLCQNQNISKDIIQKYQQKQMIYEKTIKEKEILLDNNNKLTQRNHSLENINRQTEAQNAVLKEKIVLYMKQVENMQKHIRRLKIEEQSLEEECEEGKRQKQAIRSELVTLADQVRFMEKNYKRQLEQSEKIREQLQKFWQNKEKRELNHGIGNNNNNNSSSKASLHQNYPYQADPIPESPSSYHDSENEHGNHHQQLGMPLKELTFSEAKLNHSGITQSTTFENNQSKVSKLNKSHRISKQNQENQC